MGNKKEFESKWIQSKISSHFINLLNTQFELGYSELERIGLASQLGSDCAFFIRNVPAFAEGRGNILEPIDMNFENFQVLLVNPAIHISTKEAYSGVNPVFPKISLKQLILLNSSMPKV